MLKKYIVNIEESYIEENIKSVNDEAENMKMKIEIANKTITELSTKRKKLHNNIADIENSLDERNKEMSLLLIINWLLGFVLICVLLIFLQKRGEEE